MAGKPQQNDRHPNAPRDRPPQQQRGPVMDLTVPPIAVEFKIERDHWLALSNLYPGARPESIIMVHAYCKARNLDPLRKPVHIVPMSVQNKATNQWEMRDVVMQGIQELRTTAMRTGLYAGQDKVVYGPLVEVPVSTNAAAKASKMVMVPETAEITVYRMLGGMKCAFTHVEYFDEAVNRTKEGLINSMWLKRGRGMLAKVAEAGALRKAFPEELGGEYIPEEMANHVEGTVIDGEATDVTDITDAGASGIPGPEAAPAATAAPAKAAKPAPAPEPAPEPEEEPEPAAEPQEAPAGDFAIDLPPGPRRVLDSQMHAAGVDDNWLLAKLGANVTVRNINDALAILKAKRE